MLVETRTGDDPLARWRAGFDNPEFNPGELDYHRCKDLYIESRITAARVHYSEGPTLSSSCRSVAASRQMDTSAGKRPALLISACGEDTPSATNIEKGQRCEKTQTDLGYTCPLSTGAKSF